jgi:hypothetical protein
MDDVIWINSGGGVQGSKGDTGDTGPAGPRGDTGLQGIQGIQGPKGDTGNTGTAGSKGDKGDKGDTGSQGPQGNTGPAGTTDHTLLANVGTNTHTAIDTALTRLANTSGSNTGDQTLFDATAPSTQAYGDAAVVGTATVAAHRDHKHAMPAFGYAAGSGGTVTQSSSKSTGVTLSKLCGTITMSSAALAAATTVSFTLTNTFIASTDIVLIQHSSAGTLGAYNFAVTPTSGSASIAVRNVHTASLSEAIVLRFIVIKGSTT